MSRIVLSGYFGFNNLGDEAVLYSMVEGIRRGLGPVKITVLSSSPADTARELDVEAVNRWHPGRVFGTLRNSDILVSGGGSLLQDVTGAKSLYYYLGIIRLARALGKKVMVFAQGMGPLVRESSRRSAARVLNKVDAITVRDRDSLELLRSIGVTGEIAVTADPVLGLTVSDSALEKGQAVLQQHGLADHKYILVCPRRWQDDAYLEPLVTALVALQREDYGICLFPFHKPEDTAVCRTAAETLGAGAVVLAESLALEEILGVFGRAGLVIGMRLHSLIFAAVAGTPMVGISYDPKVDSFLRLVGQPCAGPASRLPVGALLNSCGEVLNATTVYRQRLQTKRESLRKEAEKNYLLLAGLLE